MHKYIIKRLLLLPVTLFCITLVNFCIINVAPGEPVFLTEFGSQGDAMRRDRQQLGEGPENHYLQFREFFGLTRPLIYNNWGSTTKRSLVEDFEKLLSANKMAAEKSSQLRISLGDKARYCLPQLLQIATDQRLPFETRKLAFHYFLRGSLRFTNTGPSLSASQKEENEAIAKNALFLDKMRGKNLRTTQELDAALKEASDWYQPRRNELSPRYEGWQALLMAITDTRFARYMQRVLTCDFGVLRDNPGRTVISEVVSRLKYSLTLAILPMIATFILCQLFGLVMAIFSGSVLDRTLNVIFLILWALPVFVVAPFLIETIALHHTYPFTDMPFPIRGFSSDDSIYNSLTSFERLGDIARHITLPLVCIFYGSLAMQTRLSRSVFLDTLRQDFIRTARAKGVHKWDFYWKHVGKNAAIPIVTAVSGSLGLILGGSVIIETIFEIHGFGKFFYDAILNRDYHVMMFSVLVGSFLTLVGYLVADLAYMFLDPRVTLSATKS